MSEPIADLPERLKGIAGRVDAATAGLWLVADGENGRPVVYIETGAGRARVLAEFVAEADAQFVCTARERMPELLAEVARLRAELATRPSPAAVLREAADDLVSACPEHGDADEAWMDCPCEYADELRRRAALIGGAV